MGALASICVPPIALENGNARVTLSRVPEEVLPGEEHVLSASERERAERFLHPQARREFIAGRTLIRRTLGALIGTCPQQVQIGLSNGRPFLKDRGAGVDFSLSHGGGWLCLAVGRGIAVGADIEPIPDSSHVRNVAALVFSERERRLLDRLNGAARARAFCRLWTRREALLKRAAVGFEGNSTLVSHIRAPDGLRFEEGQSEGVRWCVALPHAAVVSRHQAVPFPKRENPT